MHIDEKITVLPLIKHLSRSALQSMCCDPGELMRWILWQVLD